MAPQSPRPNLFAQPARRRRPARLRCEQLEDRTTPALFTVQQPLAIAGLNNNGCVAVADLDKNGFADAVMANFGTDYATGAGTTISVLYGRSGGGFDTVTLSTGGANVTFVTTADINSDGWQDVVAVNANRQNTGSVSVFRNDGAGNLSLVGSPFSSFGNNSAGVALADLTGDGVLDVAVASFGKDNGSGNVVGNSITIFRGNADAQGKGNFTYVTAPTVLTPTITFVPNALAIADFDADGVLDIAAAVPGTPPDFGQPQPNGSVYILKGTGGGAFSLTALFDSGGVLPGNIQAVDLNGDGKKDLVVGNAGDGNTFPEWTGNSVGVLLNISTEGHVNFGVPSSLNANCNGTFAVAAADFNLDGKVDIAAVNYGSQIFSTPTAFVSVYLGNGSGSFTAGSPATYDTQTGSGGGQYLAVGDFNADGKPDLVVAHSSNFVGLLLNGSTAVPVAPKVAAAPVVNGGAAQRSKVTSISVTFSTIVSLPANVASAFTLTRIGGGAVTIGSATAATVSGATVVTLSGFSGAEASLGGSLNDGRYTLTALATQITANGQQLDGDGNGTAGDNYVFADSGLATGNQLYRFFGDITGDRFVNGADLATFRTALGSSAGDPNYNPAFDSDGDGDVDFTDLARFRTNFGANI